MLFVHQLKAKYKVITSIATALAWVQSLLYELGISLNQSPMIYYDNVGANYLCVNPMFHSYMKHIAIDFHFGMW